MRIFEVNTVYKYGSTGKIVYDIRSTLLDNGHDVTVVAGRSYDGDDSDVYIVENKAQRYINAFACRIFDNEGFGLKSPTKKLISLIDKWSPDVVHLHNIHGYYINLDLLFGYLATHAIPVVWTLHDCWSFTGHCSFFEYCGCEKWKSQCADCPQIRSYPSSMFFDNSRKNFELKKALIDRLENLCIVTPSDWLNALVKKSYMSDRRVLTINNGIDLSLFKPMKSDLRTKYGLENKKIVLAVASLWGERKGWSEYLRLASLIDNDTVLVMIGLNDNQLKSLPSGVIGIKRTSSINELVEWYSCADVFLNLTHEDNFPTVNIESLACGLPIISYKTGGATEAFDENTGIAVDKGDLNRIIELLTNRSYERLSRELCVNRAKMYDKKLCCQKYVELFNDIVGHKSV